jgi:hypothetical protein
MTDHLGHRTKLIDTLIDPSIGYFFDELTWSRVVSLARNANLLGALAERLALAEVSTCSHADRHLEGARQLSIRQRRSVEWEVHELQSTLGELGIPVVLLKGSAYVMSYQFIARGRLFGDIDVLVPRDAITAVESQLMLAGWVSAKSNDYDQRYYRQWMHEIPPLIHARRGTVIDVHHTILPLTARNAPDPAHIVARSTPIEMPGLAAIRVPCPEDLVIHSIVHVVHEGELHNALRDLFDIDQMLRGFATAEGFWSRLGEYAFGNDLAYPVLLGLHLTKLIYGTPVPPETLARLTNSSNSNAPPQWLITTYLLALSSQSNSRTNATTDFAKWLIYVRSHALRMPLAKLAQHLTRKSWMRLRENWRSPDGA